MANISNHDKVMTTVLLELQREYKLKYGREISLKQLRLIIEVQNDLLGNAVFTGEGIKLPNLGKFHISPKKSKSMTFEQVELQQRLQTNSSLVSATSDIGY